MKFVTKVQSTQLILWLKGGKLLLSGEPKNFNYYNLNL